jgi:hypothetical protein
MSTAALAAPSTTSPGVPAWRATAARAHTELVVTTVNGNG